MMRGEIYYVLPSRSEMGSEQKAGRPAIIVSNDANNQRSATVEVVYLTTKPKRDLPTHVKITSCKRPSIALCEQVTTVSVSRLDNRMGICSSRELAELDRAMMLSLGIERVQRMVRNG